MAKRKLDGTFAKGHSGNPAGRPKRTEQEKAVIDEMCELVPRAVTVLRNMLEDNETPDYLKLRAAEIVFDRVCGKPMTGIELDKLEESRNIDELFDVIF